MLGSKNDRDRTDYRRIVWTPMLDANNTPVLTASIVIHTANGNFRPGRIYRSRHAISVKNRGKGDFVAHAR